MADHFSKFHSEGRPPGEHIIVAGEKTQGLASILSGNVNFAMKKFPSPLPQKLLGPKVTSMVP